MSVSSNKTLEAWMEIRAFMAVSPFAGMIQIRFDGFDLSPRSSAQGHPGSMIVSRMGRPGFVVNASSPGY
jgi:hypothetical protein